MREIDRSGHAALRRGRVSRPGYAYVLTTVTADRRPLFGNLFAARIVVNTVVDLDREIWSESLAFVVMPDHLHWLFVLRRGTLAELVQRLKGRSSWRLGQHIVTGGRVWQPAYFDHAVRADEDLRHAARYIVMNPIRRGLADWPGGYPHWWSAWDVEGDAWARGS